MSETARELRESFLAFFEARDHRRVDSASLVPGDDPTLLFTNAGMNQFKDLFLGQEKRDYRRATSSQKCLRVSGKHNDLEQVGRTARHHTFFEMLGNFSFGDYFKKDAIRYAFEFLVNECGLATDRLWYTVFGGEGEFPADEDALGLWTSEVGVATDRVLRLGMSENFWRMGETGPCGPCTEIHYDQGPEVGCGSADCGPTCDCDRFLELWNLVFMQFEQRADGSVRPLPAPSVDTGMGLERLASVVQGVRSNYETDLFVPILDAVAGAAGVSRGSDGETDVSLQVIADHLRAIAFLVSDGVTPSSSDRGYVVRRILRRAATHADLLGQRPPFLHRFVPVVMEVMGDAYPELRRDAEHVSRVIRLEEEGFRDTLERGEKPLRDLIERARGEGKQSVAGGDVFRLYDSLGLPLDQIAAALHRAGLELPMEEFQGELDRQKERGRRAWKGAGDAASTQSYQDLAARSPSSFLGYETLRVEGARVLAILSDGTRVSSVEGPGTRAEIVLDRTPFYAEAGGQIGDVGVLEGVDGGSRARVLDTVSPARGIVVHRVELEAGSLAEGGEITAQVDAALRRETMRNHTATHLLHAALQEVLGEHAKQAGSYVGPDRLRFDFNHVQPMTGDEVEEVERLVNRVILENREVSKVLMNRVEALASGAVAFFGEKYGDEVRVVDVPGFSRELCGGTHCDATGQIGVFKILAEKGISAGVRRIEAVTGIGALERFTEDERLLAGLEEVLAVRRDRASEVVQRVLRRERELEKEVERLRLKLASSGPSEDVSKQVREVDGVRVLARVVKDLDRSAIRNLADSLKEKIRPGVVVLGAVAGERVSLVVSVTEDLRDRLDARKVIRELASIVGGGGGGHATMAEAGGRAPERLPEALEASAEVVGRLLGAA